MTIKFHSEARKEFFKAADFYEEQVIGLGDAYINEVEKVFDVIRSSHLQVPRLRQPNEDVHFPNL